MMYRVDYSIQTKIDNEWKEVVHIANVFTIEKQTNDEKNRFLQMFWLTYCKRKGFICKFVHKKNAADINDNLSSVSEK